MRGRTIALGVGLAPHAVWNPAVGVIWDIATSSGLYSWSNDRLTVTRSSGTGDQLARATLVRTVGSGSFYHEVTPTFGAGNGSIGFTDSTQATNDWVGDSPHSAGIYSGDGHVYGNGGSSLATLTTLVSGVPIGVYLDSAGKLYFRNNAGWMGGADPSAGTGGVDVSAILTSAIPAVSCNNSTTSFVANFGAQAFAYSIPTGGTSWDGSQSAGGATISGSASITEADDTLSSASAIAIAAVLAVTEAGDTLSSAGALPIVGALAKTEAGDSLSSASAVALVASLASTEAGDTLSSAAAVAIAGSLAATEGGDTLSSAGTLPIVAAAAVTEAGDTLSAVSALAIVGSLSATEAGDTLSSTAGSGLVASASITEANDSVSALGALAILAAFAVTEGADSLVATAAVAAGSITGIASVAEADDSLLAVLTRSESYLIGRRRRRGAFSDYGIWRG
jgi:hypothetical protein